MKHGFSHHSSGKFFVATEHLKGTPVFPDGMFQLGIGVPLFVKTQL